MSSAGATAGPSLVLVLRSRFLDALLIRSTSDSACLLPNPERQMGHEFCVGLYHIRPEVDRLVATGWFNVLPG
jgi:hypothetical protein